METYQMRFVKSGDAQIVARGGGKRTDGVMTTGIFSFIKNKKLVVKPWANSSGFQSIYGANKIE